MPFGMNFTSVRLDTSTATLSVHGESDAHDDPDGLAAVAELQVVLHGEDDTRPALTVRVEQPQLSSWSVTLDAPPDLGRGDVVYAVGVARGAGAPFVWFNRFTIAGLADRIPPGSAPG